MYVDIYQGDLYISFSQGHVRRYLNIVFFCVVYKTFKLHHVAYKCWICSFFSNNLVLLFKSVSFLSGRYILFNFIWGRNQRGKRIHISCIVIYLMVSGYGTLQSYKITSYTIHILHIFVWIYLFGCNIRQIWEHTFDLSTHKM